MLQLPPIMASRCLYHSKSHTRDICGTMEPHAMLGTKYHLGNLL